MRTALVLALVLVTGCRSKDFDEDGYENDVDCEDTDASISPDAEELCDGIDNDCDGTVDEGEAIDAATYFRDADGDGFGDAATTLSACEVPVGYVTDSTDCDDGQDDNFPGATERCDGEDNDCNGGADDAVGGLWFFDGDGDGFGDPTVSNQQCDGAGTWVDDHGDCDDADAGTNPSIDEVCDGADNNCDEDIDEDTAVDAPTWYADADGDGHGDPEASGTACTQPEGFVAAGDDCDDTDALQSPTAEELCDGQDTDCDGDTDEDDATDAPTWFIDYDADGFGTLTLTTQSCEPGDEYADNADDCDDTDAAINPQADDSCDGVDNNCDGSIDEDIAPTTWYIDYDGDGYGSTAYTVEACSPPAGYVTNNDDCDDTASTSNPAAVEVCDGKDNDCDSDTDEPAAVDAATWYADTDGDGFGDAASNAVACTAPSGFVASDDDCDDTDGTENPGADELCDGDDDDCDGEVDEDDAADAQLWYIDGDGDGYGDFVATAWACSAPSGFADNPDDCDPGDADQNPGAAEACTGEDDDCDGSVDENDGGIHTDWYVDIDGDGFGDASNSVTDCSPPSDLYVDDDTDCDDLDPDQSPDGDELCDDTDNNCDGVVDNDNDGDDWADDGCGGSDCDDNDSAVLPERNGGCVMGESCLDVLLDGLDAGDGSGYTIDPRGTGAFDAYCDFSFAGGGWTLAAVALVPAGGNAPTWNTTNIRDRTLFGTNTGAATYKGPAWNELWFTDVLFENGTGEYAAYEGMGDGWSSWYKFQSQIPTLTCGSTYEWPMTDGNLADPRLCNTNLYVNHADQDGGGACSADNEAYGPGWSTNNNNGCGWDDPDGSTFWSDRWGQNPFAPNNPLRMYVR